MAAFNWWRYYSHWGGISFFFFFFLILLIPYYYPYTYISLYIYALETWNLTPAHCTQHYLLLPPSLYLSPKLRQWSGDRGTGKLSGGRMEEGREEGKRRVEGGRRRRKEKGTQGKEGGQWEAFLKTLASMSYLHSHSSICSGSVSSFYVLTSMYIAFSYNFFHVCVSLSLLHI